MFLTKKAWSPYAAGIVIGLLQTDYRNRAWCFLLLRQALGDRVAERATGRGGIAVGGLGDPEGTWE